MAGNWNPNMPSATTSGSRTIAQLLDNDIYLNDKQVADKSQIDSQITALQQTVTEIVRTSNKSGHQIFYSSGIFRVPDNVSKVYVTACGGGGGGGGCHNGITLNNAHRNQGQRGGYGAHVFNYQLGVQPGASYQVTVGSGGSGGNGYNGTASSTIFSNLAAYQQYGKGGNGGNSSFGGLLTLAGGTGGLAFVSVFKRTGSGENESWLYTGAGYAADGNSPYCTAYGLFGKVGYFWPMDTAPNVVNQRDPVHAQASTGWGVPAGGSLSGVLYTGEEMFYYGWNGQPGRPGVVFVEW